jgi:hypothetical protein
MLIIGRRVWIVRSVDAVLPAHLSLQKHPAFIRFVLTGAFFHQRQAIDDNWRGEELPAISL